MNGLLLALLLLQVGPQNTGVVTGIVRGANGMPAPGIRVYAMTVRDATEAATAGTALESIAQTDAAGRYRLEVAAGRYYIASGSVGSPTYYPGTTNVAAARVISIAAGGLVESIDFSSFVPASRTGSGNPMAPLPPGSTGVLGGTIRFQNGLPAAQMPVVAIPAAAFAGPNGGLSSSIRVVSTLSSLSAGTGGQTPVFRRVVNGFNIVQAVTDVNGRYRLENIPPETYYIATGAADAPYFFPGASDIVSAQTLVTAPTTLLDNVDFAVPPQAMGVRVSGRVTAIGGAPAAGATVQLSIRSAVSPGLSAFGLQTRSLNTTATVRSDGTFEAPRVLPGDYSVEVRGMGVRANPRMLTIAAQPVNGLDFSIPVASLSGRILLDDGSALPNPQVFTDAIVTTVDNPNLVASTVVPISSDGSFAHILEPKEYRFYLRNLPDEYTITTITAGTQDLLKETLKVTSTEPAILEVRVAKRTEPSGAGNLKVSGSVHDSFTGLPTLAERVTLCCLDSGPWERFSTPLRSDGSFEFAGVPRGRYELGLQVGTSQPKLFPVDSRVDVAGGPTAGLTFLSTPQLSQLRATIVFENGSPLPAAALPSVVFTGRSGLARVVAQSNGDEGYLASVPAGDQYDVSVTNLPEGYIVKPITGSIDIPRAPQASPGAPVPAPQIVVPIQITIAPSVPQPPR